MAAIARALGISRPTVQVLTPDIPYLPRRWRESGADSRQRWRELQALG
jgi:hypothetical protein